MRMRMYMCVCMRVYIVFEVQSYLLLFSIENYNMLFLIKNSKIKKSLI